MPKLNRQTQYKRLSKWVTYCTSLLYKTCWNRHPPPNLLILKHFLEEEEEEEARLVEEYKKT